MAEQTGQERNLPATPRKRRKAREEGQVAKSREVNSVLILGGALGLFALFGGTWMRSVTETVHRSARNSQSKLLESIKQSLEDIEKETRIKKENLSELTKELSPNPIEQEGTA